MAGYYGTLRNETLHGAPQKSAPKKPAPSDATLAASAHAALRDLDQWIRINQVPRIALASPEVLLGPVMDQGTYYYRVGRVEAGDHSVIGEGWGMNSRELKEHMEDMKELGLPPANGTELNAINRQYYNTLNDARPNRNFVVKHFPGGNELLETTERQLVHYGKDDPIAKWIAGFDPVLQAHRKPFGVMLSHASYDLHAFPGIDRMKQPVIPGFVTDAVKAAHHMPKETSSLDAFSVVPASMNPYVTQYLREAKGYRGIVVGDWYDMKSASYFVGKLSPEFHKLVGNHQTLDNEPTDGDVRFIMGVTAGVNYSRPSINTNGDFWNDFRTHAPQAYKQFDDRLNQTILSTYNALKGPNDPPRSIADIAKLSLDNRAQLIASITEGSSEFQKDKPRYEKDLARDFSRFPDKSLFDVINVRNQVVANDVWDRTGVMTMQFRKNVVEHVSGAKFPDAPPLAKGEPAWLKSLMGNHQFRETYDRINWDKVAHFANNLPQQKADAHTTPKKSAKPAAPVQP